MDEAEVGDQPGPPADSLNILPTVHNLDRDDFYPPAEVDRKLDILPNGHSTSHARYGGPEDDELEALLVAQRARTPVAVALAQDYSEVTFKVPRPFVLLGWFWVVDAWVSYCLCCGR